MAGDWIKIEHALPDKPEVMEMATILGIDSDAVVGKLIRVWTWFDNHTTNGNAPVTVRALLDRYTGVTNFVTTMQNAGWITETDGMLSVVHFDRHNGQTAKNRANTNRRVAKSRNCNGDSVTNVTSKPLRKPLPEKRREEKSIIPPNPQGGFELAIEESEKPDLQRIAVGKLLGRRDSTKWDADEMKLYKSILPIHPDDMALMQAFYGADIPKEEDRRRTDVMRLLKHWNGELDKARAFKLSKR